MAQKHFLRFIIRHEEQDLIFEVREQESDRLRTVLSELTEPLRTAEFFWFDTVDGLSVALNLVDVQAVRFLWDAAEAAADLTRTEDWIRFKFRGRSTTLEASTDDLDELYDLFVNLQHGPEVVPFPSFTDEDGEPLQINAEELVWVTAPTQLIDEGKRLVAEQDGIDKDA